MLMHRGCLAVLMSLAGGLPIAAGQSLTCTITAPADGAVFPGGADFAVTAEAAGGTVDRVELYVHDWALLGTDATSPYEFPLQDVPAGAYVYRAVAFDVAGNAAPSAPVHVVVGAGGNFPPDVDMTTPEQGQKYATGDPLFVEAAASDFDGQVARVDFYAEQDTWLGEDAEPPYTWSYPSTPAGTWTLTAVATDELGVQTTSWPIVIHVADGHSYFDFLLFADCLSGPGQPAGGGCAALDLDTDGDVDLADFAEFQRSYDGTGAFTKLTELVPMSDGVHLATDIYRPAATADPLPAVLLRTVYNKAAQVGGGLLDYVGAGAAVVVQDCRGRFASEGVDCVFQCDHDDGHDALAWIAAQPWSDGQVATVGGSASGITQYLAAPGAPDALVAVHPHVGTPAVCEHAMFQNGVFRKCMIEGWLAGQGSSWYLDTIAEHPECGDPHWDASCTTGLFAQVNVPGAHIGGWYDIFAQGTLDAFVGYHNQGGPQAQGRQKLIIGPWDHGSNGSWQLDSGETFTFPAAHDYQWVGQYGWVLHYLGLQPIPEEIDAVPPVQYYVMGDVDDPSAPGNEWRAADNWPPEAQPRRFFLQPGGGLSESSPPPGGGFTGYTYDPADPSPTRGGANLILPSGPRDQRPVEQRDDVLVFETPLLTEPLEVIGRVAARIHAATDTLDTDIMVRMTDVYPDGKSMLICDAPGRLSLPGPYAPGEVVAVEVDLWSTAIIFAPGHRLRISVSSSNYPRFRANPNDGSLFGEGPPIVAHVQIHHSAAYPSCLELPCPVPASTSPAAEAD